MHFQSATQCIYLDNIKKSYSLVAYLFRLVTFILHSLRSYDDRDAYSYLIMLCKRLLVDLSKQLSKVERQQRSVNDLKVSVTWKEANWLVEVFENKPCNGISLNIDRRTRSHTSVEWVHTHKEARNANGSLIFAWKQVLILDNKHEEKKLFSRNKKQ